MRRAVAGTAAAVLGLGLAVVLQAPSTGVPLLGPDCTLAADGGTRGLSRDEAVALTTVATDPVLSVPGSLSCRVDQPETVEEPEGPRGLTPRAARVLAEVEGVFGPQALGGFAPGGVRTGHVEGSAHYEGRAVDVFFRPVTPEGRARGWVLAHWLVASAERLDVATVIYDRRIWTAARSGSGWRDYRHPSGDTTNPVRNHEDHVHVDVGR